MPDYVARKDDLVVEPLDRGLVVYDTRSDQAHWLDPIAAAVWQACADGANERELASLADGASSAAAVARLLDIGLIQTVPNGVSRRTVLRTAAKVGVAGAAASPIISAIIPVAAAHASTGTGGGPGGGGGTQMSFTVQSGFDNPGGANDGQPDPNNQESDDGSHYGPALLTSNGAYDVLPGTSYIASVYQDNVQNFYFRSTNPIYIPPGATNATISGSFYSDNDGYVFVNGNQAANNVGSGHQFKSPATPFSAVLVAGQNNPLTFTVYNSGGPSGLDYYATVTYTI